MPELAGGKMKKVFLFLFLSSVLFGDEASDKVSGANKTTNKGILLSILLPGLGEQYLGETKGAIRGYIAEGVIWATYFGAHWYAGGIADNYTLHSKLNAGALPENIDKTEREKYYDAVEWYESLESYNTAIRDEAYARYEKPAEQLEYIKDNTFGDSVKWVWSDTTKWEEYRNLRKSRRDILHKSTYCLGAAVLNRVISVLMVNYRIPKNYGINIEPNGIKLSYSFY